MPRTKKQLEKFEDNLQKLSDNLDNITNNVDDINNQFEGYNEQITNIKDNVKSLESELKEFMHEVKVSPIIEKAKQDLIKEKEELNNKYNIHNQIRERLLNIINNIDNIELVKTFLLSKEEENNFKISNYYLSSILLYFNDLIKNKKGLNNKLQDALNINKEKTSLLLLIISIKIKNEKETLKWLNNYLDEVNPLKTNDNIVKLIDYLKDNESLLNIVLNKINEWQNTINKDENTLDNIYKNLNSFVKIKTINDNDYPYIYNYTHEFDDILDELYSSSVYNDFYTKISYSINIKTTEFNFLIDLIYSSEKYEKELKTKILENEYIINNNGKIKKFISVENTDVFSIFLHSLNSKKYSKETKEILIKYLKQYILNYLNQFETNNIEYINIQIQDWSNTTKDGSNEVELINNISEFIKKPFDEENNKLDIVNFKTIYSFVFIIIGLIISFFYSIIGFSMIIVGAAMLIYFIYFLDLQKKNNIMLYNNTLKQYEEELYNTLAEIVDIKMEVNNNLKNKDLLLQYLNNIN